ncbi:MAG: GTP-binding protein [Planctomycetota bacterium]
MKLTKIALIGGFLGAGKTTLIGEIARRYRAAGKRVGIITNDQADDLVDTMNLRSQGFDVGEVSGACFCCSFDHLVDTADQLIGEHQPDLLLAEPVGSCTDLVATVVVPLKNLLGDRFELAPFGVLLKPSHGERILNSSRSARSSGFSAQAEYIFRKQIEEADYIMVGRRDQLDDQKFDQLTELISHAAPGVRVFGVSPTRGDGVDEVIGEIESPGVAGRRLLEIDYDTYAIGEAELGWVNLAATWTPDNSVSQIDLNILVKSLVQGIADAAQVHGEIAHLKASAAAEQTRAVANVVANAAEVDLGLAAGHQVSGDIDVIINARVAMDPDLLKTLCEETLQRMSCEQSVPGVGPGMIEISSAVSLRPGRPTPTHRFTTTTPQ